MIRWEPFDIGLQLFHNDVAVAIVRIRKSRTRNGGPKQVYEVHFEYCVGWHGNHRKREFNRIHLACEWAEGQVEKYHVDE